MTYNQVFFESLIAGAYIKCSWIELFAESGTKLLSLQRSDFDECLGYATYSPLMNMKGKVAITPSEELIDCLRSYAEIAKNNKNIIDEVLRLKEPVVYIKNHCAEWKAEKVENKKSFWAKLLAGISLFI